MDVPYYITDEVLERLIETALKEDVGEGDVTTEATVPEDTQAEARFLAKADGILAGQAVADRVFERVDPRISVAWSRTDGQSIFSGTVFGTAEGPARSLLTAERLVLNLMQRMSGIATKTRRFVNAVRDHPARILDTRKTAPGLRVIDKWAVRLGGGENHRLGLHDMMLVKDNHIAAAGGIEAALAAADRYRHRMGRVDIEVETRTLDEIRAVLDSGVADRILLDNMVGLMADGRADVSRLQEAVDLVAGRVPTEASGNVTLASVRAIAGTGVSFISSGALTHSVEALDISLQMELTTRGSTIRPA
ncbi:MAG: carboxylating nicotinate-nucleotide diphosphorylase [Rhodothermales bacterium]